ncbi:MAG: LysM peptidoglycan-binding domain-containing protein [Proteobacteria bacterium]|nr:LysM peptidoglycan-binding domain-containing protein [Pseudomonadota bacterium]
MIFKKQHLILVVLFATLSTAQAQVELNPTHPDTYVVVKGDTLWDISSLFLKSPWLWPEIWHVNPQIENPHLIYPGDVISLVYLDGKPQLVVNRDHPTVKLGPKIRTIDHNDAIKTISLKDIEPFLRRLRILSKDEIDAAPYVVAGEEGRSVITPPYSIYVRNLKNVKQGDRFAVVKPTVIYREVPENYPWETSKSRRVESLKWVKSSDYTSKAVLARFWKNYIDRTYWESVEILGYEVADTAIAEVTRVGTGDVTTLTLKSATAEVMRGDLILPIDEFRFDLYFTPKPATLDDSNIRIVALNNALFGSGKRQIVAISKGSADGVTTGDVFSVNRPERIIRDEVMHPKEDLKTLFRPSKAKVTLPEENVGHIMIFKTFDRISYAIITGGNRPVKMFDFVRLP